MSAPIRRRGWFAAWTGDLAFGVRLAVGGGRASPTSIVRLLLGTVGVGVAVTVLLFAASAGHAISERGNRQLALAVDEMPVAGAQPLTMRDTPTSFRGETISVRYVHADAPSAPVPPGLDRVPAPGETVLSPALAELLRSDSGTLLRPRFSEPISGTIGQPGLVNPDDLRAYVGADSFLQGKQVYAFGGTAEPDGLDPGLLTLLLIGIVSLLSPVFVFVATSARIAGAERDRRLAALRLVGSDLPQVRRIAAAESLVTVVTGLVLGAAAFLSLRQLAPSVRVRQGGLFVSDVTPPWPLVVLIVVAVPVLSVLSSLLALRGTTIEPLGVVRHARPVRRRLWWRLVPVLAGVLALCTLSLRDDNSSLTTIVIVIAVSCLLIGVPVLLPWLLERAVGRLSGGRPAFQLAVRRLQLDSGTPARVVAGLAVVLAGAIAVQSLLAGQSGLDPGPLRQPGAQQLSVDTDSVAAGEVAAALDEVPGVSAVHLTRSVQLQGPDPSRSFGITVASCPTWQALGLLRDCRDGAVYADHSATTLVHSGQSYPVSYYNEEQAPLGTWTVPDLVPVTLSPDARYSGVLATPGALAGLDLSPVPLTGEVRVTSDDPDFGEIARNAIAPFTWHASLYLPDPVRLTESQRSYLAIRAGLLAGSVFTLLLAGVSLLVLGLEQLRERRRTIAMLAATGVPVWVLARSVVWQNAIPLLLGIATAVATGVGLSALGARLTHADFTVDWLAVGVLSAAAAALVLLVTTVTLPSLRGAARLASMRTE
ncbi:ABC transporter permease [Amycolatopsis jiangsuensis]|uniref:ABC3 transporter permease C-terminal domain-containing protein n=1 Tax=Amycolatopsis jiangsuensis TaxID=1181879 RepID=A0A840J2G2_9PSEU|nr:FtsX-like permease family protein [Amycolatopsis jiangsuensis]MBB4687929.1 hypothetical protein [Amycolatopsis jiangsuensis]